MPILWDCWPPRRHQAALARAEDAARQQGWRDCERHYQPLVTQLRQRVADAALERASAVERAYADGWNEGQAFAVRGNAAWPIRTPRAS